MKRNLVLIIIAIGMFSIFGCKHPCLNKTTVNHKKIIVFVDVVKGNEQIFIDKFMPKIEKLLKSNIFSETSYLFSLEVFPITKNSSSEKALVNYTLTKDKSKKICRIKGEYKNQVYEIIEQFKRNNKIFKTRDTSLSILYTIPLLSERLSFRRESEEVFIIYLSDLVELHNPSNENNGYFSFLEPVTNTIDILSISIANDQIKNKQSEIGKLIHRGKKNIHDCNIIVYKPNVIKVNPDKYRNHRYKIDEFWKNLFNEFGIPIDVKHLSDLEDNLEFK